MVGTGRAFSFRAIVAAIVADDLAVLQTTAAAKARAAGADERFVAALGHQIYEGDTALHLAAAARRARLVDALLEAGADVAAANRLGAQPLHYAADGGPGSASWDPRAQAAVIRRLVAAGADPNARTKLGVAPLHRAARGPCAGAVEALLASGADPGLRNRRGSTPREIAARLAGRSGSGSADAKREQAEILRLLG